MNFLLALFPGKIWIYAIAAGVIFTAGGTAAYKFQGMRLDAVKAEYKGFVATTKAQGEAAQKVAKAQEAADKLNKQKADDENKRTTDSLNSTIKRLRSARAGGGYLPPAAPGASSPATATIDRAEFERAVGKLDLGVQKIVDTGSKAVIDLDTAKKWAKK